MALRQLPACFALGVFKVISRRSVIKFYCNFKISSKLLALSISCENVSHADYILIIK